MLPKNPKVDLKLKYQRVFEVSLILSILLMISAFRYFPNMGNSSSIINLPTPPDLIISVDPPPIPPAVPPPPIQKIILDEYLTDDELEDIEIEDTDWDENDIISTSPPQPEEDEYEYDGIFEAVEEMPKIIGGLSALQKNIYYPEIARKAGIQGKVFLEVVIGKDGEVEKIKVLKGIGIGCDEAAIAAVMKTKFAPGKQRGKPVRVQLGIPISFVLEN
jgi:periplasmic protein TonB